jgi:hypothetical protein
MGFRNHVTFVTRERATPKTVTKNGNPLGHVCCCS